MIDQKLHQSDGSQSPSDEIHYTREMGLDHRDFFRLLPRAMGSHEYRVEGSQVYAEVGMGSLHIVIGPEQLRRIALLALPYCEVSFTFHGVTTEEQQAFKAYFDLRYQRGGG